MPLPATTARFERFKVELAAAGIAVRHEPYLPTPNAAERPCVYCPTMQHIIAAVRATTGRVEWGALGKGWILYPL